MPNSDKKSYPSESEIREFWLKCGLKEGTCGWLYNLEKPLNPIFPSIDPNNLFEYAIPIAISKLENRFDAQTNLVRGLELLFARWTDKVREGYSFEDALFWTIREILDGN